MPPKRKTPKGGKTQTEKPKGKKSKSTAKSTGMNLQKNPKKKVQDDQVDHVSKPNSVKKQKAAKSNDTIDSEEGDVDGVSLTTPDSEFDSDSPIDEEQSSSENRSSNATVDGSAGVTAPVTSGEAGLSSTIGKQVTEAVSKYMKEMTKRKKCKKKKSKRRLSSSSESSVSSSYYSSSSDDDSSDSSESDCDRPGKRRKHRDRRDRRKRRKRGEKRINELVQNSPSHSTVYTRGCKSPQLAVMHDSSDKSLDGGNVSSGLDNDGFVNSLNTSRDRSTPFVDHRRSRLRTPENKK